jgi:hypothetical protein
MLTLLLRQARERDSTTAEGRHPPALGEPRPETAAVALGEIAASEADLRDGGGAGVQSSSNGVSAAGSAAAAVVNSSNSAAASASGDGTNDGPQAAYAPADNSAVAASAEAQVDSRYLSYMSLQRQVFAQGETAIDTMVAGICAVYERDVERLIRFGQIFEEVRTEYDQRRSTLKQTPDRLARVLRQHMTPAAAAHPARSGTAAHSRHTVGFCFAFLNRPPPSHNTRPIFFRMMMMMMMNALCSARVRQVKLHADAFGCYVAERTSHEHPLGCCWASRLGRVVAEQHGHQTRQRRICSPSARRQARQPNDHPQSRARRWPHAVGDTRRPGTACYHQAHKGDGGGKKKWLIALMMAAICGWGS